MSLSEIKSSLRENGVQTPPDEKSEEAKADLDNNNVQMKISDDFDSCMKFPVDRLKIKDPVSLPPGIDPTKKEVCLCV